MALFKNYLQRLIEANAAADAEAGQSGATDLSAYVSEAGISLTTAEGEAINLAGAECGINTDSISLNATEGTYIQGDNDNWFMVDGSGLAIDTEGVGFFGTSPAAKPTGVAVTAEAIHAALVTLGLIAGP